MPFAKIRATYPAAQPSHYHPRFKRGRSGWTWMRIKEQRC
jgi:hypothetical protein